MQIQIYGFIQPDFHIKELVSHFQRLTGRNLLATADDKNLDLKNMPALILALEQFKSYNREKDALASIRHASSSLEHLYFGFLVLSDGKLPYYLAVNTNLRIISTEESFGHFSLITGSLYDWKYVIIDSDNDPKGVRYFYNLCQDYFEQSGIIEIWGNYSRKKLTDGTFKLLPKS